MIADDSRHTPTRLEPITVGRYDVSWPESFERERARVAAVLQPWLVGPVETSAARFASESPVTRADPD